MTRHGTNRCYNEGCRRPECIHAHGVATQQWHLRAAANGGSSMVPAWRVHRRIEALVAIGYSAQQIADEMGCSVHRVKSLRRKSPKSVLLSTFRSVDAAYRRLEHTPGPSDWLRTWAKNRSWPPPAAWENIDDENENAAKAIRKEA